MRTKFKKLTSLLLAVIMVFGIFTIVPITVSAAEEDGESVSETSGDFEYFVDWNEKTRIIITGYNGSETDLVIPSTIEGYTVEVIDEYAFSKCTSLKSVNIPSSVDYIWEYAVGYIYDEESSGYNKIDGFTIYGYTNSGAEVYARNNGFAFVSLGEVSPFRYCLDWDETASIINYLGSETDLIIPSTLDGYDVAGIGSYAFDECTSLKSVTIPSSVDYIGEYAVGYTYDEESCEYKKIDDFTIYGYTKSLAEVYAKDNGFAFVSLGEVSPFRYQHLDDGTVYISAYYGSETDLIIPSTLDGYTVTGIDSYAFEGCTSLESVTIPDSITVIDEYAFKGCTNLVSVTIPDSVTYIGSSAFEGCTSLVSITIPDCVKSIGESAFENCTNLKSVTIPSSVDDIGYCAFGYTYDEENCEYNKIDGFTIYSYTNSEAEVYARNNDFTFVSLGELSPLRYELLDDGTVEITAYYGSETDLTIPSTIDGYIVSKIGWYAFENCTSLVSITIPDSVTIISGDAFENCTSLKSVTIPDSVTIIVDFAFSNCTSLKSVTIPDGVTYIGDYVFSYCTSLVSVTIPDSVTRIGGNAFVDCTSLKSVTIPSSVFYIGDYAVGYAHDEENWENKKKIDGFTIYGYAGSEAEKYANDNGFTFINLEDVPAPMLGDVDGDGKISIDDVTDIQKFAANMIDFTEEQEALADVNKDEKISIDDVTLIQKNLAGLATF